MGGGFQAVAVEIGIGVYEVDFLEVEEVVFSALRHYDERVSSVYAFEPLL